jgi:hypothetical protein
VLSGDHAAERTLAVRSVRVNSCLPVVGSHSRTVWSELTQASRVPSGDLGRPEAVTLGHTPVTHRCLPNWTLWDQGAACGGAGVVEFVVLRACPLGPVPLAARGLAAVLARAGPGGRTGSLAVSGVLGTPCDGPSSRIGMTVTVPTAGVAAAYCRPIGR